MSAKSQIHEDLPIIVLNFFDIPKCAEGMHKEEVFDGYSPEDVRTVRTAMVRSGLLKTTGYKRGTVYERTQLGINLIESS